MVRTRVMKEIGVGLIGCGNISTIYLTNLPLSPGLKVLACSDMRPEIAEAQGKKFGVEAMPVDALLARGDIDIVVNLTVPAAHAAVSLAALSAGKHVFSEKPLAVDVGLARRIIEEAEARGLMVGCAPDTFLGAGGRLARRLIDEGAIGRVLSGTAFVMSHGMEHWHPDPEFFFKPGGGPVLDVGPYHVTALINLLGPVARVLALTGAGFPERIVTAEGARKGHRLAVETPTTALSLLEFRCSAQVMFGTSWDVWRHSLPAIELYGTEGSMRVPDPNFFGGIVEVSEKGGAWNEHDSAAMPLGRPNWPDKELRLANYRALGVADLAAALRSGGKNYASGRLALHALEVMAAILEAGATRSAVAISTEVERPPALSEEQAARLFKLRRFTSGPAANWHPASWKRRA
jgi:predicted dehydrogenase